MVSLAACLVAGLILFLGVLALIVLGLTSGDDTAKSPVGAATAPEGAVQAVEAPAIAFGGAGIPEVGAVTLVGDPLAPVDSGDGDTDASRGHTRSRDHRTKSGYR